MRHIGGNADFLNDMSLYHLAQQQWAPDYASVELCVKVELVIVVQARVSYVEKAV